MTDASGYAEQVKRDWFNARKKPVQVEARGPYHAPQVVETLEGDFEVDESYVETHGGFYIIRGVQGEVYPCGADIFEETYGVEDNRLPLWSQKACENIEEWGLQDVETLLLAMQEEQGELSQAFLESEHEDGDVERIQSELDDLAALCVQLQERLNNAE